MRVAAAVLSFLIAGALSAEGAAVAPAPEGPAVPHVTVAAGRTSGVRQPLQVVVRDAAGWQELWRRHAGLTGPAPAVDFAREMVVALFAGTSSVPRAVTITRIVREPERLTVWYVVRETLPAPEAEGLSATSPYHIVRLARSPLPVSFSPVKTFPPVNP